MTRHFYTKQAASLMMIALLSSPAVADKSSDEYYESASKLFFDQDNKGALIELKNALQKNSEHVPSLLLSAQLLLRMEEPAAAEEYFIKARVLGADRSFIELQLAEAYKKQAKYREIIKDLSVNGLKPADKAELLGYQAEAWLAEGNEPEAAASIAEADLINPRALRSNLARTLLNIQLQKFADAENNALNTIKNHPSSAEALNSYASSLHAQGKLNPALAEYAKALEINPKLINARIARVGLLIDLEQYQSALTDLDYMKVEFPSEPRAAYLRSLVYSKLATPENDYKALSLAELKKCTEFVAQLPPNKVTTDIQLSMMTALAHFSLGEYEASKAYLDLYLKRLPYDLGANRLMGQILINLDDPLSAIKLLAPISRGYPKDGQLLNMLATAYAQIGQYQKSTELLERLREITPNDTLNESRRAVNLLNSGYISTGISELQNAFLQNPDRADLGEPLVVAKIRNGQFTEALDDAKQLVQLRPDDLSAQNLLGVAYRAAGKLEDARKIFTDMTESNSGNIPAQINLSKTDELLGKVEDSRKRLTELQSLHPENASVQLSLAQLEQRQGNLRQAITFANKAKELNPTAIDTRQLLIELYLSTGQAQDAENIALETATQRANDFESSTLLAQTLSKTGQNTKAINIYKRMVKEAGYNSESLYKIAYFLIQEQAWEAARHALYKATEGDPNHLGAQIDYIRIQLTLKEFDDSLKRSLQFIKNQPDNIRGYILAGDSSMGLGQPAKAEQFYEQGLAKNFDLRLMQGYYNALMAQAKTDQASDFLESRWREYQPNPAVGKLYSDHLIASADFKTARTVLDTLKPVMNDHPEFLGQLAYVYSELEDPSALDLATQAQNLSPDNPYINDTLGWLLVKSGQPQDGLKYLRQANARQTDSPAMRYHLGKALFDLERLAEAKPELQAALKNPSEFRGRKEAEKLLKYIEK